MSHLDRAYRRVSYAAYHASDFGDARHALRQAVDDLRVARAFDLARMVEKELDHAVDEPFCDNILTAIDRRCTGRAMKAAI